MFNNTQDLRNMLSPSTLYTNSEVSCPVTSHLLMNAGCNSKYTGEVLSMDQSNHTLAKMNSVATTELLFCIAVTNKDQVLTFDNIQYTQKASCSDFMTIDQGALESFMTISQDPEVLFNLEQSSNKAKRVDITKTISWAENQACQSSSSIV